MFGSHRVPKQVTPVTESLSPAAQATLSEFSARRASAGRIGELLVSESLITPKQLALALERQKVVGRRLGQVLVNEGMVDPRQLATVLAAQLGLEVADLRFETPDPVATALLSEETARSLNAVPMSSLGSNQITVAVEDPLHDGLLQTLLTETGRDVVLVVSPAPDIRQALNAAYRSVAQIERYAEEFTSTGDQGTSGTPLSVAAAQDSPIVRVVDLIIVQAVRDRASDVHIEPRGDRVVVRNRIDGALHESLDLPGSMAQALVSRLKVLSGMNIVERRRPQDGQIRREVDGRELDLRVAVSPVVHGEKVVLRVLDRQRALFDLSDLGMSESAYASYHEQVSAPFGMVLCAGPTGSGKTTTLYATLGEVNTPDVNITTVEDPVEYVLPTINQIQINEAAGLTFATGLRGILRLDPDVILVGEIRDVETASIAVQSALTGHRVLSSIHATDAASALHRFLDMGIEPFLVASSVLSVVGQRLVRRICPACKTSYEPRKEEVTFYERIGGASKAEFYHGVGCNLCAQTGYQDRVGVYEVLTMTDRMKDLVIAQASHKEIRSLAIEEGMSPLRSEALDLVATDVTTIAEVLRSVYPL